MEDGRGADIGSGDAERVERLLAERREESERRAVLMRDVLLLMLAFMAVFMFRPLIVRILCGAAMTGLAAHLFASWRGLKRHGDGESEE